MTTVARERQVGKQPDDPLVDLLLGPRRLASSQDTSPLEIDALLGNGGLDTAALDAAIDFVGDAIRYGRPEGRELLGLLRDRLASTSSGPDTHAVARILRLATILGRERRDISAVQAAHEAMVLGHEAIEQRDRRGSRAGRQGLESATIRNALRANQELVELLDALGLQARAWCALRHMSLLLEHGDPDDHIEQKGWRQQYFQTRSSLSRHTGEASGRSKRWLPRAELEARRSLDLVDEAELPDGYRLVATNQLVSAKLAALDLCDRTDVSMRRRLERAARCQLEKSLALAESVEPGADRPTCNGRLGAARRWWTLALSCGDDDEVEEARSSTLRMICGLALQADWDKVGILENATRARGLDPVDLRHLDGMAATRRLDRLVVVSIAGFDRG